MSGGVGPTGDITLPQEQQPTHDEILQPQQNLTPKKPTKGFFFLTFNRLNSLAIMIVFAASGMVCLEDFLLVLFSIIYVFFLSKFAFPTHSSVQQQPVFDPKGRILNLYMLFTAIIALFLPILYIFEGVLEGDKEGIKAAVPHVFLLASQVFMEGVSASSRFSLPIFVFVPVFYNSIRMISLVGWVRDEMLKVWEGKYGGSSRRLLVGRTLAWVNLGLWSFNLFGFLLPVYLPKAFKIYYSDGSINKKD